MNDMTNSAQMQTGNAEGDIDVVVYDRFFSGAATGTCVEIGAARPDWLSIGALYRGKGWDVVSVEPNPVFAQMHRELGHTVLEYACGTEDQDDVDFSVVDSQGVGYRDGNVSNESWSSLSIKDEYAELKPDLNIKKIKVKVRRLDTLLASYRPAWTGIDLITADVEGWELEVLSGLDFAKYRPKILIIENLFLAGSYRKFFRERGYHLWRYEAPNDVYVRRDLLRGSERFWSSMRIAIPTLVGRTRRQLGRLRRRLGGSRKS
jgi:FkbM family methyltransferase